MISLHVHSNYSLLQGTIRVEDLVDYAEKEGSSFVALTDTNVMYGLIKLAKLAVAKKIKPILGVLIDDPNNIDEHCIFLAKNNKGYSQICRFITDRNIREDFSISELFLEDLENMFLITSSLELLKKIEYTPIVKKNLFVELFVTKKWKPKVRQLYEFAREQNLEIVATHPAYFYKAEDYELHKVVSAIKKNTTLAKLEDTDIVDPEFYLRTPEEFGKLWKSLPEVISNAERIVKECNVDLELGKYKFPHFPLPNTESDAFNYLSRICGTELRKKYTVLTTQIRERLEYELRVIDQQGFTDYFLVVWEIIKEAHKRNALTVGRGSAANSLVAYCLNFHQVDPIAHNLYFERFLNMARTSPPDIDIDFSWAERDDIVKYVFQRFGYDRVAMISTMITFRARSAFREVAKIFGLSETKISQYRKHIPWTSAKNLPTIYEHFPESKSLKYDFTTEPLKSIVEIASRLSEFPRHISIHPGGIVIAPSLITNFTALEYAANKGIGIIVTQPDMYSIEDIGLVKIDLLSQRSLGVLRDSIDMITQNVSETESI
ncbi:MAG: DNA polymerase III subunit alpha [Melioribacteraceae bacterium]|nr:DNA polymerase III subunit alpha [Melioribacteraceae bacterium]